VPLSGLIGPSISSAGFIVAAEGAQFAIISLQATAGRSSQRVVNSLINRNGAQPSDALRLMLARHPADIDQASPDFGEL